MLLERSLTLSARGLLPLDDELGLASAPALADVSAFITKAMDGAPAAAPPKLTELAPSPAVTTARAAVMLPAPSSVARTVAEARPAPAVGAKPPAPPSSVAAPAAAPKPHAEPIAPVHRVPPAPPSVPMTPAEPEKPLRLRTAEAMETVENLLAEIELRLGALARMSADRQRLHMLVWICRARAVEESMPGVRDVEPPWRASRAD